jgi:hypothetical protein
MNPLFSTIFVPASLRSSRKTLGEIFSNSCCGVLRAVRIGRVYPGIEFITVGPKVIQN